MKVKWFSRVRLLAIPWTAAYQAPPSMGFSRQEYWSGVPLPSLPLCLELVKWMNSANRMGTTYPNWKYGISQKRLTNIRFCSQMALVVKNLPMQKTLAQSIGSQRVRHLACMYATFTEHYPHAKYLLCIMILARWGQLLFHF